MTTLYCAVCRTRFEPDDDHTWVTMEHKRIDEQNTVDEYALCTDCWLDVIGEWGEPA